LEQENNESAEVFYNIKIIKNSDDELNDNSE
jgi:hypothetical protein